MLLEDVTDTIRETFSPEEKAMYDNFMSSKSDEEQEKYLNDMTADAENTEEACKAILNDVKQAAEEKEAAVDHPSPPADVPAAQTPSTDLEKKKQREALFEEEMKERKAVAKEQQEGFKQVKDFREGQAKGRRQGEEEEGAARKAMYKEEKAGWEAITGFWKKQGADMEKGQKKLGKEETDARKALEKEELEELRGIGKHREGEAKARKAAEDGEAAARKALEKEELQELEGIGKLREKQRKERAALEAEETQAAKGVEKEEAGGRNDLLKQLAKVWEAEYLKRRTEKEKAWQTDNTKTCSNCSAKFGLLKRKHHCRSCGGVFCDKCTSNRIAMPDNGYTSKERCCAVCFGKRWEETKS